jgi:hypothetical protein
MNSIRADARHRRAPKQFRADLCSTLGHDTVQNGPSRGKPESACWKQSIGRQFATQKPDTPKRVRLRKRQLKPKPL